MVNLFLIISLYLTFILADYVIFWKTHFFRALYSVHSVLQSLICCLYSYIAFTLKKSQKYHHCVGYRLNVLYCCLQGFCPDSVQSGYDRDITQDTTFTLMCTVNTGTFLPVFFQYNGLSSLFVQISILLSLSFYFRIKYVYLWKEPSF